MPRSLIESDTLERAVLVFVNDDENEDEMVEAELEGLCEAAGVEPVGVIRQRLSAPLKSSFVGKGKVQEIALFAADCGAELVIVDGEVSGIQQRNLEEGLGKRVVDRTQLILDIFASRARTKEGQLQVELAQLSYLMPKLMSVYTKFERQKGGIGLRGPGETKLESDRRVIKEKIARLKAELEEVRRSRTQHRASRRRHPFPFASLVGYTSAGKSTIMNRLAGTELLADAMPFATLDPTTRKIDLPDGYSLFLTDTVGFIRKLPTHLIAAFRSTLEEVTFSDFVIHVIDASHPAWEAQRDAVLETLELLGAQGKPMVTVFNKIDLLDSAAPRLLVAQWPGAQAISAANGTGIHGLLEALQRQVQELLGAVRALVPYSESALVQDCYDFGRVHLVEYRDEGIYLEADLVEEMRRKLARFVLTSDGEATAS